MDTRVQPTNLDLLAEILTAPPQLVPGGMRLGDRVIPLRGGVLRFREDSGYNQSFALQWNRFKTNQIDAVNGTRLSMKHFAETGSDLCNLEGKLCSKQAAAQGVSLGSWPKPGRVWWRLIIPPPSTPVTRITAGSITSSFCNANIFDMPFRPGVFDYVFCHGVLQHTPDPKSAFEALAPLVPPGGRIWIDVYRKNGLIRPWK